MDEPGWFLLIGGVLFAIGLTQPLMRLLPLTNAIVYLAIGIILGPTILGVIHFNPLEQSATLKLIAEIAVVLSLFTAGMKMPVPVTFPRWRGPILMAFVAMTMTVALVGAFGYFALSLPLGAAILLGGILAPTDPVLAGEVQVRRPGDRHRLRFCLTAEAGMNDGSVMPVIMLGMGLLGLHELGALGAQWAIQDVLWATSAGIGLGIAAGFGVGHLVHHLRQKHGGLTPLLDDFIALGMAGLVYGVSLATGVWGFLAVFTAAVVLRQTEVRLMGAPRAPGHLGSRSTGSRAAGPRSPGITENSLSVHEALERLAELILIMLLGGMLFLDSWSWRAVAVALFLFLVARPLAVLVVAQATRFPFRLRSLVGWFGVRGIGSLYYIVYLIEQGLPTDLALELLHITLVVITLSIFLHGISTKPVLARYMPSPWRARTS